MLIAMWNTVRTLLMRLEKVIKILSVGVEDIHVIL